MIVSKIMFRRLLLTLAGVFRRSIGNRNLQPPSVFSEDLFSIPCHDFDRQTTPQLTQKTDDFRIDSERPKRKKRQNVERGEKTAKIFVLYRIEQRCCMLKGVGGGESKPRPDFPTISSPRNCILCMCTWSKSELTFLWRSNWSISTHLIQCTLQRQSYVAQNSSFTSCSWFSSPANERWKNKSNFLLPPVWPVQIVPFIRTYILARIQVWP